MKTLFTKEKSEAAATELKSKKRASLGRTYDLQSLYDRLNRLYFDSQLKLSIRWGKQNLVKARSNVLLGSYFDKSKEIVISRRLDNPRVPLYFLEHVIFHEMLHSVFPREKHRMHTEKFKKFERLHPDFDRAREWEKTSLKILFESNQISLFNSLMARIS
ncbi:MAG: hypothetical protein COV44_06780 [Deltaproteobacteria bacterium CG11_big_fil_rev_8_21_14_0_20_45_16]|nr:MAG: hypothetical protein COV44_06780 [Deltaproteobacteria bacterium CG11_big_fil_rev_8_21_14_0_20_45_16]